jgi:hypothetical protein
MPRAIVICTMLGALLMSAEAPAQPRFTYPATGTHLLEDRATAGAAAGPLTKRQGSRDSLENGAVVGAILGGLGAALFGAYLCNAVGEEGDPPCWRGVLVIGALGAGAGAAAGAGVDAMLFRSGPRLVLRVRF